MAADKVSPCAQPCANAPTLLSCTVQGICCCTLVCLSLHEETG